MVLHLPSFTKKGVSNIKQKKEKVNTTIKCWIFELAKGPKFQLKLTILGFFDQIWPKMEFPVEHGKIALVRASIVVTYYIKLFRTGDDRHNGILMSLLLLVAETIKSIFRHFSSKQINPTFLKGESATLRYFSNLLVSKLHDWPKIKRIKCCAKTRSFPPLSYLEFVCAEIFIKLSKISLASASKFLKFKGN